MIPIEIWENLTGPEMMEVPLGSIVFYPPYYFQACVFAVGMFALVAGFFLGREYQRKRGL